MTATVPASDEIRQAWLRLDRVRRVVIKIGSNLLTGGGDSLRLDWIRQVCQEITALTDRGLQPVVVTSGAIAAGIPLLKLGHRPVLLREKQAAAAAGQGILMRCYEEAFAAQGRHAAQILLTREDVRDRQRYLNARDTMETLMDLGLIPVVNENDTVGVSEIRFGDNDTLAALVAGLVGAELLILLSDVAGLYAADPRCDPTARLIPLVSRITPEIEALAGGTGSAVGSGGMITKIKAAKKAARFGCQTILANGFLERPVARLFDPHGKPPGTLFLAETSVIDNRKRWIANGLTGEGVLDLDPGAVRAILDGKSLLARGLLGVDGGFRRGAAVYCRTPQGQQIAKGLVNYDADQLRKIVGQHSSAFEAILGFSADEEVIHRNNMVILESFF